MKRHFLLTTAFLVACGSSGSADDSQPTDVGTGRADGGPGSIPGKGTPDELNERFGVFVATNGKDTNEGSRGAPFASIGAAINAASASNRRVYVCAGKYEEAIVVANGVSISGGFDCSQAPAWNIGTGRSIVVSPTSPALTARHIDRGTRIEALDITAPDGNGTNASSIALLAEGATALLISNTKLTAGKGADGAPGTDGIQLTPQASLPGFGTSYAPYTCPPNASCILLGGGFAHWPGGLGGTVSCTGAAGHDGEAGGKGATSGVLVNAMGWGPYKGQSNELPTPGEVRSGSGGAPGNDGASARGIGRITTEGYIPADGTAGSDGMPGHGGSGGSAQPPPSAPLPSQPTGSDDLWKGTIGSGGGAGGCPGLAGTPGRGGGASIAALLIGNAVAFDSSELIAHDGGAGGAGTLGSDASTGSSPGNSFIAAAKGTSGGAGGRAGVSGSGAGGPSFAVAYTGSTAPTLSHDTKITIGKGGAGVVGSTSTDSRPFNARSLAASAPGTAEATHAF